MEQYHTLLKEILGRGDVQYEPRTQEYTLGISAWQSIYDLRKGFPLMITKEVNARKVFEEGFWKLRGERNVKSLVDKNVNFWTANAYDRYLRTANPQLQKQKHSPQWNEGLAEYSKKIKEDSEFAEKAGDLGPVYGYQWRHWPKFSLVPAHAEGADWIPESWERGEVDQLTKMLKGIKERPGSRYHLLSSWNVADLDDMAIGPCPMIHQFTTYAKGVMDLTMIQRSCDVFLGVPFNIAQDSLLTHMIANETGFVPRFFNHSYNNVHAYLGVSPRADFWMNPENVNEFQGRFNVIHGHSPEYLDLKDWYLKNAPPESQGNERKDHIPFILEQLSKTPGQLSVLEIKKEIPLFEAIEMPAMKYAKIIGYEPAKWDSKAVMAA